MPTIISQWCKIIIVMNTIKTKSILKNKSESDGIRIAVMRRVKSEHDFDLWFPVLSPSTQLVETYAKNKEITWEEFIPNFFEELAANEHYLSYLVEMAKDKPVTLLCYEEDGSGCHRTLLLKRIKELYPEQQIEFD